MALFLVCYAFLILGSVHMLQLLKVSNPSVVNGILDIFSNKNLVMKVINWGVILASPMLFYVTDEKTALVLLFLLMYPTLVIWCADIKQVKIKK